MILRYKVYQELLERLEMTPRTWRGSSALAWRLSTIAPLEDCLAERKPKKHV